MLSVMVDIWSVDRLVAKHVRPENQLVMSIIKASWEKRCTTLTSYRGSGANLGSNLIIWQNIEVLISSNGIIWGNTFSLHAGCVVDICSRSTILQSSSCSLPNKSNSDSPASFPWVYFSISFMLQLMCAAGSVSQQENK